MSLTRPAPPKPCPRCYAPMTKTANGYSCERHGWPTPLRLPLSTFAAIPAQPPRTRRGRSTGVPVFCNGHEAKIIAAPSGLYCSVCDTQLPPIFAAAL